jgi:hypothetical protein
VPGENAARVSNLRREDLPDHPNRQLVALERTVCNND